MGFKSRARLVFVDTEPIEVHEQEKLDIILSPRFYWVKRQSLPVKYLREVKKLLPSLFEDTLEDEKYSYSAYKEDDSFLLFAYKDKEILERLQACGIDAAHINNIYFAQSEFSQLENGARFSDTALIVKDGVVVQLPKAFVAQSTPIDIQNHELSKHKIELARYSHIADDTSMRKFMIFMGVLIALFASEWAIVASKLDAIAAKEEQVFEKEGLRASNIQNQAILTRLDKRYNRQTAIRNLSGLFLDIKLQEGERLQRLELVKNSVVAEFSIAQKTRIKAIDNLVAQSGFKYTKTYDKQVLRFEVAL